MLIQLSLYKFVSRELTHISLAFLFGDRGKQCRGLHCLHAGDLSKIDTKMKIKNTPDTLNIGNGLVQYIVHYANMG